MIRYGPSRASAKMSSADRPSRIGCASEHLAADIAAIHGRQTSAG